MGKALIGHVTSDLRTTAALSRENRRLRTRVEDLQALVLRLQAENDQLGAERASARLTSA
ncbi:MAG: hypothetical protein LH477_10545 [Nocardioides sp.]|nr:hypothetical protein [Nocardioides sp.]